jgi:hypothetical protein
VKASEDNEADITEKKVIKTGFFLEGKFINWETVPQDLVKVKKTSGGPVVICGDVEIAPWTDKLRKSLSSRDWVKV